MDPDLLVRRTDPDPHQNVRDPQNWMRDMRYSCYSQFRIADLKDNCSVLTLLCCLVHVPGVRVCEDGLRGPDERAVDLPPHPRQHGAGRLHLGELRQEEQSDHVSKGQTRCIL